MGGSGRGVFLLEQQRKDALFLLSRPVLETTLARLEYIWRSCQGRHTSCPRLSFLSPCFLHTFTQLPLWHLSGNDVKSLAYLSVSYRFTMHPPASLYSCIIAGIAFLML